MWSQLRQGHRHTPLPSSPCGRRPALSLASEATYSSDEARGSQTRTTEACNSGGPLSPVRTLEGHDQLPQVQRGESSEVPLVRLLRCAADAGSGTIARCTRFDRTVTIVFCDLKGSTSLGESLDPEALHEVKDRYFSAMAAEITRHGGKIEKYIGDAIMAVFGLPLPHEDDALRAVRAAAGMQAALGKVNADLGARYGVSLANRTGVNTGEVVANDDPTADQKLVTGDAVNVTARLEQAAPENQIYLGETTYRLVRDAVEVESGRAARAEGQAGARRRIPAGLGARASTAMRAARTARWSAARKSSRPSTRRCARPPRAAQARLVTIIGDAGMGKSRLAREVIASERRRECPRRPRALPAVRRRHHVLAAARHRRRAPPTSASTTTRKRRCAKLAALRRRCRRRGAAGRRDRPDDGRLPAARDQLGGAQVPRDAGRRPAAGRARSTTSTGPRPAFLELLENMLDTAENAPILLLATSRHDLLEKRPEWGERPAALRLVLRPLTDAWAARVAENLLGSTGLPADIVNRIVEAAEGQSALHRADPVDAGRHQGAAPGRRALGARRGLRRDLDSADDQGAARGAARPARSRGAHGDRAGFGDRAAVRGAGRGVAGAGAGAGGHHAATSSH